jgi:hypothetical protein
MVRAPGRAEIGASAPNTLGSAYTEATSVSFAPRAVDPALDVPTAQLGDGGRLLVGHADGADQHQRLALLGRQQWQRLAEVLHVEMTLSDPGRPEALAVLRAVAVLDLAPPLAQSRKK